jgi:4a-hydroxytetrahydrobiopterin dehydratase
MTLDELRRQSCVPRKGPQSRLDEARARELLALLPGWELGAHAASIAKRFVFPDFAQALAFLNAIGWIAEQQNHHPDVELGWGRCLVRWSTHDVGGLSLNDFICAARVEQLCV